MPRTVAVAESRIISVRSNSSAEDSALCASYPFTKQAPQRLRTLREHALIESAVSSNRIEGVEVDGARIATVVFGKRILRDRDEEEVRGYRTALSLIHAKGTRLKVSEKTIQNLKEVLEPSLVSCKICR